MVSAAEEALEESGSAVAASGSQLQQGGQSEASEDSYPCPSCLGEVNNAACMALCFHLFWFGCIQQWAAMRAVSPLCRRPFDHVLRVLPADKEEEEDRAGFSACHQRNMAQERSRSKSPQGRYVLDRSAINYEPPAWRRRPVGSDRALRGDRASGPPNTTSQQAPVPSASWAPTPPSAGERVVSPGHGACVCIGTLALPPPHVQLSFQTAQETSSCFSPGVFSKPKNNPLPGILSNIVSAM